MKLNSHAYSKGALEKHRLSDICINILQILYAFQKYWSLGVTQKARIKVEAMFSIKSLQDTGEQISSSPVLVTEGNCFTYFSMLLYT